MDVVDSYHKESSLNEHDFPTNNGLRLVLSGTFVFRIMCRRKHRDGAGIQRPPDSARLVVMARQTTRRTAGKVVFIVPESLLFIHVCCRPPPRITATIECTTRGFPIYKVCCCLCTDILLILICWKCNFILSESFWMLSELPAQISAI